MIKDVLSVISTAIVIGLGPFAFAAQSTKTPEDALLAALVWGEYHGIDVNSYRPEVKTELERARQRLELSRSPRRRPINSSDEEMLYQVMVRYERLLVAFAADSKAQALAVKYVDSLRPCYEWEGYHDCPQREASFATDYFAAHPSGPFKDYLPLLAAHRWLCTAEGYEYEQRPEDAARSRRAADDAIRTARRSTDRLIRMAAEALHKRSRCFLG
jgi:hypothetical protein